ncbi:hypothetical protein HYR65_04255 [Candidatus Azambacteria bacterium]|nr:hypothetical protein [Candidatus Azambacteria bacterium]
MNGAIAECSRAVSFGEVPWVVISVDSTQLTIDPALTDYWQGFVRIIAHEIGHTFTRNHTANMSIMDPGGPADYPTFKLPPDMARAFWILYFELKPFDPIPAQ